jgi:hypothetical protein
MDYVTPHPNLTAHLQIVAAQQHAVELHTIVAELVPPVQLILGNQVAVLYHATLSAILEIREAAVLQYLIIIVMEKHVKAHLVPIIAVLRLVVAIIIGGLAHQQVIVHKANVAIMEIVE